MWKFLQLLPLLAAFLCLKCVPTIAQDSQLELGKAENNNVLVELPTINLTSLHSEQPLMRLTRLYGEIPSLNFTRIYRRFFSGGSNATTTTTAKTTTSTTTTTAKPDPVEPLKMDEGLNHPQNLLYQLTPVLPHNPGLNPLLNYAPEARSNQLVNLQIPYQQAQQLFGRQTYGNGYNYAYPNYGALYGNPGYNNIPGIQGVQQPFPSFGNFYDYNNPDTSHLQNGYQLFNGNGRQQLYQDYSPYRQWVQSQYELLERDRYRNDYNWPGEDYESNLDSGDNLWRQLEATPTKMKHKGKRRRRPTRKLNRRSKKRQQQRRRFKRFNY